MHDFLRRPSWIASVLLIASLLVPAGCTSNRAQPAPASDSAVAIADPVSSATEPIAPTQAEPSRHGDIVAAPSNIRNFAPKETARPATVAADSIDFRAVFEELGEDTTLWFQHVQTLANPFFEGRAPNTRGGEIAAEYLEFYFRLYGLEPAFPSAAQEMGGDAVQEWSSYRQPFDFASPNPDVRVIEAVGSLNGEPLTEGTDFVVLGNSGSGTFTGPVTFVGYGIVEGKDGYTSFEENTDLTGRIALLMRYEPLNEEGKSQWSQARFSTHSTLAGKMKNVADRGASAIVLVNPPGAVDGKTALETIKESSRFGRRMDVPTIQISVSVAERVLAAGDPEKRDMLAWRRLADNGEIKCANLDDSLQLSITTSLEVDDRIKAENVAGVLRGKGSLADQWIVIGGHYDHVGYGYTGAMPQNIGRLHPGADDNASGTAAVLIAARRFAQQYAKAGDDASLRSIMFIGFDAEEAGLHGSRRFVEEPPVSLGAINLMINMDMVGRLRNNNLLVQGTGTAEAFDEVLKPMFESSGLKISASPGGRGPSDHSNFYGKDIPVLFLFTGTHDEYHKPGDYGYTVNPVGAVKIVDLLENVAMHFAKTPERLKFKSSTTSAGPGRNTGANVSLGTIPDYAAELETGMRVEDVREGSAAAEAGIQGGDVLLTWNGAEIAGARNLMEYLGKHRAGDRITIVLRRGNEEKSVEVVLKARVIQ